MVLEGKDGLVCSSWDPVKDSGTPAKVIQMYVDGTKPVLFLGSEMHSRALEKILQMLRLPYSFMNLQGKDKGPALSGENYRVVGMGHGSVYGNQISIKKNSCSSGYEKRIDPEHLEKARPYLNGLELEVV